MEINSFTGAYRFLSNFYYSAIKIDGEVWYTNEHYFQAQKTEDLEIRTEIKNTDTPGKAKRIGGKCCVRSNWDSMKYNVMLKAVRAKFAQNNLLAKRLKNTAPALLIEGNVWHDNVWGNCSCKKCKDIKGRNLLGEILMLVRDELKE